MRCLLLLLALFLPASRVEAGVTFAWDASPSGNVAGYTLMYGTASGSYTHLIDVGSSTTFTLTSLSHGTYYFAVRAYAHDGRTSAPSRELLVIHGSVTRSVPSGCGTPDPFASLGGGTCYNGGWLPPGIAPQPGTPAVSAPAPGPASSRPPQNRTTCATPNPFASMGGGTCYNGGWLPPGMMPPGADPPPAPTPAAAPVPTIPAPSERSESSGWCTTPNPFAAMGGGTCYNGGWLPPGIMPPSSSPAPFPSPGPAPSTPLTCTTPDPFFSMGGGTCANGGWLPPGMFSAASSTGMSITVTGTLHVINARRGGWLVEATNGTMFTSSSVLDPEMLVDGAIVTLHGVTNPGADTGTDRIVVDVIEFTIHQ